MALVAGRKCDDMIVSQNTVLGNQDRPAIEGCVSMASDVVIVEAGVGAVIVSELLVKRSLFQRAKVGGVLIRRLRGHEMAETSPND